jgi:hypothetical protein
MRKYLLTILLIIAFLFSAFAVYQYLKDDPIHLYSSNKLKDTNPDTGLNQNPATNIETPNQESQTSDKSEKTQEEPATDTEETNNQSDSQVKLPSDINTRECGLYYGEYGVCAGSCPSGTCVSEGRSCYCKNIEF